MKRLISVLISASVLLVLINQVFAWENITEDWDDGIGWNQEVRDSHSFAYNGDSYIALAIFDPTQSAISIRKDEDSNNKFHKWEEVLYINLAGTIDNAAAPAVFLEGNGYATVYIASFDHYRSTLHQLRIHLPSESIIGTLQPVSFAGRPPGYDPAIHGGALPPTDNGIGMTDAFVWSYNNHTYMMATRWITGPKGSWIVWSVQNSDGSWTVPWKVYMATPSGELYHVDRKDEIDYANYNPIVEKYDYVVEAPFVSGSRVFWSVGWSDNDYPRVPVLKDWQGIRYGTLAYYTPTSCGYPYIIANTLNQESDIQIQSTYAPDSFYTHPDINPYNQNIRATSRDTTFTTHTNTNIIECGECSP